jgi:hypothetical protein
LPGLTISASATGDIKRNRHQVSYFDEFHITPRFYYQARDFMAEYQARGSRGSSADHVLVAATNIGRNNFKDNAVLAFPVADCELGIIDGLNFNLTGFDIGDAVILTHNIWIEGE